MLVVTMGKISCLGSLLNKNVSHSFLTRNSDRKKNILMEQVIKTSDAGYMYAYPYIYINYVHVYN